MTNLSRRAFLTRLIAAGLAPFLVRASQLASPIMLPDGGPTPYIPESDEVTKVRTYERITVEYEPAHHRTTFICHQSLSSWPDVFVAYPNMGSHAYRGQLGRNVDTMPLWPIVGFEVDMDKREVKWREST